MATISTIVETLLQLTRLTLGIVSYFHRISHLSSKWWNLLKSFLSHYWSSVRRNHQSSSSTACGVSDQSGTKPQLVAKILATNNIGVYFCNICNVFNKSNLRDLIAATGLVISNWIQIVNFSARVSVKFDGWPCKTIGHLFYATSSFVHHFVAIGEFKLQLQSGNAQSGSNSTIFRAVRPWNLTDDLAKQ